jgi:hypothetical protein
VALTRLLGDIDEDKTGKVAQNERPIKFLSGSPLTCLCHHTIIFSLELARILSPLLCENRDRRKVLEQEGVGDAKKRIAVALWSTFPRLGDLVSARLGPTPSQAGVAGRQRRFANHRLKGGAGEGSERGGEGRDTAWDILVERGGV